MSAEQRTIRIAVRRASAGASAADAAPRVAGALARLSPPTDIHEGPEGLILEADLPGATDQDVVVRLEDQILSLEARVGRRVPEGCRALYEESHPVEFARSFILSEEVERSRITAELKNGVLRLSLPRAERARSRRIEVKAT
jgi:HSP20 family protein